MDRGERNALIEEYGRGYDLLTAALAEVPLEARQWKPAPREWSIHEILIHMADSEAMAIVRARMLIAEPGATIMPYEDSLWSGALDYENQDADDALQFFKVARRLTYNLLKTLPDEVFSNSAEHPTGGYPEYGDVYTLEKWVKVYTRHVRDHIGQLQQAAKAWKERAR